MINPLFFISKPVSFQGICDVYPPTVTQVLQDANYGIYTKLLTYSQEDLQDDLDELAKKNGQEAPAKQTPLEYLLANTYFSEQFREAAFDAFKFYTHCEVIFNYDAKSIDFFTDEGIKSLTEENYFDFQNLVRNSIGAQELEKPNPNVDARVLEIRAKARRAKRRKKQNNNGAQLSLTTYLNAICCMGIGLNPLNIGEISYASMNLLIEMYQQKEQYDQDIRSILAGADPKKVKPKYWIREKSNLVEVNI